jgi:Fe-S oxidoreductase
MYNFAIRLLGATQGLWSNKLSRKLLSAFPRGLLPTRIPYQRYLPKLSRTSVRERYPELVDIPASRADIALFTGCTSDLFEEPLADSFIRIAKKNGWKISLPSQRCGGEPFSAVGNLAETHRLARYNIDQLADYKYVIAFCPSCLYTSPAALEEVVGAGAEKGVSPKDVAARMEVIITMLPDSPQVKEVALGKDGVIEGARPGSIPGSSCTDKNTDPMKKTRPESGNSPAVFSSRHRACGPFGSDN